MKKTKFILFFILFILGQVIYLKGQANVALNKQVIGTFNSMPNITDGKKEPGNYAEPIPKENVEKFFVIVLGQAKYLDKIRIYWVKNYEPEEYKIEVGKNLFEWEKSYVQKFTSGKEEKGLVITEHNLGSLPYFFVKLSITKSTKPVRISEVELLEGKIDIGEIKITDFKFLEIGENHVKVQFSTTIPTAAFVKVGEETYAMKESPMELDLYKDHIITYSGLLSGTEYYIQPFALDVNSKIIMDKVYQFKTKGIPLPRIKRLNVTKVESFGCFVEFKANVEVQIDLFVEINGKFEKIFHTDSKYKEAEIKIEGLIPESYYVCKLVITDQYGKTAEKNFDFKTEIENIALGKKVYGSFLYEEKSNNPVFELLSRVTDGVLDVNGIVVSGDVRTEDQQAIVDLGKVYKLRSISVIWRAIDFPKIFEVYIGNDLQNMQLLKKNIYTKYESRTIFSHGSIGLMLREITIDCFGKEARFVKVFVPKETPSESDLPFPPQPFLQLSEIKVFPLIDYASPNFKVSIKEIK